jgi:sulfatase modifying factor 1
MKGVMKFVAIVAVATGSASPVWADDVDGDGVDDPIDVCENTPAGTAVDAEGRPWGDADKDCDTDLDDFALFQQGMTGPLAYVVFDTVTIGNLGNADDTHGDGYGGVDYVYNVGRFEVTAGQYTQFLNAVADDDTYGLYNASMWSNSYGCKIERTGSSPNYEYSVAADWADRPVNYVSWGDAARFCNWLHNGQPTGQLTGDPTQDAGLTEDGSYYLNGATTDGALIAIVREDDATWVIPSEDEWYKAAYHKNDGVTGNYFNYPTSTDSVPSNDLIDPDPGNNATFWDGHCTIDSPYWRTEFGAHENSDSPYGTFDQGGNVWEWNEAVIGSYRGLRGGSFDYNDYALRAADRVSGVDPSYEFYYIGLRVVEVP